VTDARFNVSTVLNYDGTVSCRYCYDAYGTPKELSADWSTWQTIAEDRFLFTGRLHTKDVAQGDLRNRALDSAVNYFLQEDPLGRLADEVNFGNGFAVMGNDPLNSLDPTGLKTATCVLAGAFLDASENVDIPDESNLVCTCLWRCNCTPEYVCARGPGNENIYQVQSIAASIDDDCEAVCLGQNRPTFECCAYTASEVDLYQDPAYAVDVYNAQINACRTAEIGLEICTLLTLPFIRAKTGWHAAHHTFRFFGRRAHWQLNMWVRNVPNSGIAFRVPY
jgi:RHS repeat-associated protein